MEGEVIQPASEENAPSSPPPLLPPSASVPELEKWPRLNTQIACIVAVVLFSLFLSYSWLSSSRDAHVYGAPWMLEIWRNRRPHLNQSIILPYCHLARDTMAEINWLQQARSVTGEDNALNDTSRKWRERHCLIDPRMLITSLMEGSNALERLELAKIANFSAHYGPRISSVILDLAHGGRVLYPVTWMDETPGRNPQSGLIDHNVLCIQLEEMTRAYATIAQEKHFLEPEQIKIPCFCPVHLGIVGSGLHFVHNASNQPQLRRQEEIGDREAPCEWNILVDVRSIAGGHAKQRREHVQLQRILSDINEWEKRLMGPEIQDLVVSYNAYSTLQAYNLIPLLGADQDFRLSGVAGMDEEDLLQLTLGERLLLQNLPSFRVYTVSMDVQNNPNACFQHCQRLELMVMGDQLETDRFTPVTYTPIVSRLGPLTLPSEPTEPAIHNQVPFSVQGLTERTRQERERRLRERQDTRKKDL
jgi:hypothetical protein